MLNAGRKPGSFIHLRQGYGGSCWLLAKIFGYKPILRLISSRQAHFYAKNLIGLLNYQVPAQRRFVDRSEQLHLRPPKLQRRRAFLFNKNFPGSLKLLRATVDTVQRHHTPKCTSLRLRSPSYIRDFALRDPG